jgi:hypothetical protein
VDATLLGSSVISRFGIGDISMLVCHKSFCTQRREFVNIAAVKDATDGLVGHAVAYFIDALCYKPEGRRIDSR